MSKTMNSTGLAVVAATAVSVAAVTAAVTQHYTVKSEKAKLERLNLENYQRELELRKKTIEARKASKDGEKAPPSGTVLNDIYVDKVYLWEIEDLNKRFPGTKIENVMRVDREFHNTPTTQDNGDNDKKPRRTSNIAKATSYNKLINNHECILGNVVRKPNMKTESVAYVRAGPRKYLHFDPEEVNAAIVTCGGLCPGLNNVVREITRSLHQLYGIRGKVYGIRGGYSGFHTDNPRLQPIELTTFSVEDIHHSGGTFLGSSRGGFDFDKIYEFIKAKNIKQLYVIGGDGTHRGAFQIHEGAMEKGIDLAVACIPKTIDNDVDHIDRSFGFSTAVEAAQLAIRSAKTEAVCNLPNGIGIVKLMGRSAGYIAAHATMSSTEVDLCLVPEVPIVLDGPKGCLPHLMRRVKEQGYAVVVVAEGAGEELLGTSAEKDASGNKILPAIGEFMKKEIESHFKKNNDVATVKYIDPSYTIRSCPANASDSLYCMQLAQNAVHGAMAGYTGFSVGLCNNKSVYIPIPELVATSPRSLNPTGRTWERILAITRQPNTVPSV